MGITNSQTGLRLHVRRDFQASSRRPTGPSVRDWSGIPRPQGLESLATTRRPPQGSAVGLYNSHFFVVPVARSSVRAPRVISLCEALDSANNTTMRIGAWNGVPAFGRCAKKARNTFVGPR